MDVSGLAEPAVFVGLAPDLGLDHMELGDSAERLGGQRCRSCRMQLVEFAPRMCSTGCFVDPVVFKPGVEAGVGIGLQHASNSAKCVFGWMPMRSGV